MPGPRKQSFAKPKNAKGTFRRILTYFRPYRLQLVLVLIGLLVSVAANIAGTYMLAPIINVYIIPWIGNENPDFTGLIGQLAVMAAVYTIGILGTFMYNRLMINVSTGTLTRLRLEMFTKMQTLPISYFDRRTHGEIMSTYTNDTDVMREMISQGLPSFISSAVRIVGVFTMMIVLNPILTGIAILMLVIMMLITKAIAGRSGRFFKARQDSVGKVNGYIEEMIEGQKVVKVFCHEQAVNSRFDELNETLRKNTAAASTLASIMGPIMNNLSHVTYAIIAASGGLLGVAGIIDIGTLGAFLQYTRSFSMPVAEISQQANNVLSALAGAERIFALLDEKAEEDEGDIVMVNARVNEKGELEECSERTEVWAWKKPTGELIRVRGDVRFEDVTFSYDGKVDVLKNVSLYAKPGQKIAFVGSTGAGKTTITNLINRFYDIQSGRITYDGIPIRQIKKASLRGSLGMVLQDTHLFTGTVRENIRYGRLDATDEEIVSAAKLANAHYFISHLPEGYDTVLTADGANLSQGQRQLIAIARAAVADPPVLILDEATSSIDTRTESLIEKGMDSLMKDRTVFVIAHRLSTVRNSDAIMVLEHGEIIERGNHDELIKQQGKYYQLYMGMFELS
ncbi:aBC-type multidrug transport system ATPase and permease components [Clostridium sp. CAG:226]|jgi:ATP-binding cassette subfamily B protein|nr:aBC-type multidrug transport system ATPase and permease components [Clostridium sp. CAG:226]